MSEEIRVARARRATTGDLTARFSEVELLSDDDLACNDARRLYTELLAQNPNWNSLTKPQADQIKGVVKILRTTADKGHALSQHSLAVVCERGHGIRKDTNEAYKLWVKAAERSSEVDGKPGTIASFW